MFLGLFQLLFIIYHGETVRNKLATLTLTGFDDGKNNTELKDVEMMTVTTRIGPNLIES